MFILKCRVLRIFRQSTWTASAETTINASDAQYRHQGRSPRQPTSSTGRRSNSISSGLKPKSQRLRNRSRSRSGSGDLRGVLREAHPAHGILAEESGETGPESEYQWIIDPLDGTTNFIHGFPQYAVSIALAKNGVVEAGGLSMTWCETSCLPPARAAVPFSTIAVSA